MQSVHSHEELTNNGHVTRLKDTINASKQSKKPTLQPAVIIKKILSMEESNRTYKENDDLAVKNEESYRW